MNFNIRSIKPEEVNTVFELLVQLAKYEKIEDRLELTAPRMKEELFGEKADWNCLVAISEQSEIMGFTLFSYANINRAFNCTPLIHIDDIFVKAEFRQLGIGKLFLKEIAAKANERGIDRIELWCIKDNLLGQSFYNKLGARKMDFLDVFQFDVDVLLPNIIEA